jgi:hypothetical protein
VAAARGDAAEKTARATRFVQAGGMGEIVTRAAP